MDQVSDTGKKLMERESKAVNLSVELRRKDKVIAKVIITSIEKKATTTFFFKVLKGKWEYTGSKEEKGWGDSFSKTLFRLIFGKTGRLVNKLPDTFVFESDGETIGYETWCSIMYEEAHLNHYAKLEERACNEPGDSGSEYDFDPDTDYKDPSIEQFVISNLVRFASSVITASII